MGKQESESRRRSRVSSLQKIVLRTVGIAGVLSVVFVAPNVIGAMGKLGLLPRKRQGEYVNRSWKRLIQQGFIKLQGNHIRLTKKGEDYLQLIELENFFSNRIKKRWDNKWRVLIFDIPEKKRHIRDHVRRILIQIGFIRLQDSVWLYPYDCEDIITLFKADLHIGREVLYLIVDSLEYDIPYRKHFKL